MLIALYIYTISALIVFLYLTLVKKITPRHAAIQHTNTSSTYFYPHFFRSSIPRWQ